MIPRCMCGGSQLLRDAIRARSVATASHSHVHVDKHRHMGARNLRSSRQAAGRRVGAVTQSAKVQRAPLQLLTFLWTASAGVEAGAYIRRRFTTTSTLPPVVSRSQPSDSLAGSAHPSICVLWDGNSTPLDSHRGMVNRGSSTRVHLRFCVLCEDAHPAPTRPPLCHILLHLA